jgi:hypothetical protein
MDQVRRVVTRAGRRLVFNTFLQNVSITLTGAMALAILAGGAGVQLERSSRRTGCGAWARASYLVVAFVDVGHPQAPCGGEQVDERGPREALNTTARREEPGSVANTMRDRQEPQRA